MEIVRVRRVGREVRLGDSSLIWKRPSEDEGAGRWKKFGGLSGRDGRTRPSTVL